MSLSQRRRRFGCCFHWLGLYGQLERCDFQDVPWVDALTFSVKILLLLSELACDVSHAKLKENYINHSSSWNIENAERVYMKMTVTSASIWM